MKRRVFITALGGAVVTWPLAARAQRLDRMRRIGVLLPYIESDSQAQARVTALQTALQKQGWASGRNIAFEFRYAEGQLEVVSLVMV
jgi:putative ABC transport system substrate-binding protein